MADVNIGAELQALPLGYLLSAPMTAAIEAQALAAQTTADFLTNVTMVDDGAGDLSAVMVEFTYTGTVTDPTDPSVSIDKEFALRVPLLAITQVPYLRINDLTISFEFKIRDVQSLATKLKVAGNTTVTTSSSFTGKYHSGGGLMSFLGMPGGSAQYQNSFKLTASASASYQRSERHETDRSATYKLNMNAVQDPIPEGMRRVLEILASAINQSTTTP